MVAATIDQGPRELRDRVAALAAAGHALEGILDELLRRWSGVRLATIDAAHALAVEAAQAGDAASHRTALLLRLLGRTGLFQ